MDFLDVLPIGTIALGLFALALHTDARRLEVANRPTPLGLSAARWLNLPFITACLLSTLKATGVLTGSDVNLLSLPLMLAIPAVYIASRPRKPSLEQQQAALERERAHLEEVARRNNDIAYWSNISLTNHTQ